MSLMRSALLSRSTSPKLSRALSRSTMISWSNSRCQISGSYSSSAFTLPDALLSAFSVSMHGNLAGSAPWSISFSITILSSRSLICATYFLFVFSLPIQDLIFHLMRPGFSEEDLLSNLNLHLSYNLNRCNH